MGAELLHCLEILLGKNKGREKSKSVSVLPSIANEMRGGVFVHLEGGLAAETKNQSIGGSGVSGEVVPLLRPVVRRRAQCGRPTSESFSVALAGIGPWLRVPVVATGSGVSDECEAPFVALGETQAQRHCDTTGVAGQFCPKSNDTAVVPRSWLGGTFVGGGGWWW